MICLLVCSNMLHSFIIALHKSNLGNLIRCYLRIDRLDVMVNEVKWMVNGVGDGNERMNILWLA